MSQLTAEAVDFLQSPWPDLLAYLVDPEYIESRLDYGEVKASLGDEWAWSRWKEGLHFERREPWSDHGGWSHRPCGMIPWVALRDLIASHPAELAQIRALAEGRGTPRSLGWRWFMQPAIMRTGMHHSYIEHEREDGYYATEPWWPTRPNGYADKLNAWLLAWRVAGALWIEPADLIEWAAVTG